MQFPKGSVDGPDEPIQKCWRHLLVSVCVFDFWMMLFFWYIGVCLYTLYIIWYVFCLGNSSWWLKRYQILVRICSLWGMSLIREVQNKLPARDNHLQKCLVRRYVSSREGIPELFLPCFYLGGRNNLQRLEVRGFQWLREYPAICWDNPPSSL